MEFKLRYQYLRANLCNLRQCLNKDLIGLHFSGHGLKNEKATYGNDSEAYKDFQNEGDFLLFEQKDGASLNIYANTLEGILQEYIGKDGEMVLKFVVVASCHSENCGQIFLKAGVEHVICVDKTKQLNDKAAILFGRTFYQSVFSSPQTIC